MSGKYALIIGNTEYNDPGLAQLTAPGKDAEDFARVLKDKEICAFDEVNILLNQPEYQIREAIYDLFSQKKPDDLLVLYFSGHGVRDEFGVLYLAVKNTNRSKLGATAVDSSYITRAMDQSRSKRQVLILDCCNSGAFAQGTKAATGVSIGTAAAFEAGYGRIILTASDSTQFAWEGDKVIGETDNSLFTHYLVEGLNGVADRDGDGRITVDELYDFAYEQVKLATPKQTPSKFSSKQQGEIVLRHNIRIEDTIPLSLPEDLIAAIKSSLPFVREGAVRQLEELLKGRNLGLARSARLALERIAEEDDSRRVSQLATEALDTIRKADELAKQKEVEEQKRLEEEGSGRTTMQKAEARRLVGERAREAERQEKENAKLLAEEKAEAERKAREYADRLAAQKAEEERRAKINLEAEKFLELEEERLAKAKQEERKNSVPSRIDPRFAFLLSAQKRVLTGSIIGFILWVFAKLILNNDQVESWSWVILVGGCALAGLIMYPHKSSPALFIFGFLAWGIIGVATLDSGYSITEVVFMFISLGTFYGLFTGALISRLLFWLKTIN